MSGMLLGVLGFSLSCAFLAIVLGRNLTRSIVAGFAAFAALALALLLARGGFVGLVVLTLGASTLATIQLFGWMLVDVDRDHLPPTDAATAFARGLAFLLFGGALIAWVVHAISRGELGPALHGDPLAIAPKLISMAESQAIGALLFGPLRDVVTVLGFAVAAALLAAILLLRNEGRENG